MAAYNNIMSQLTFKFPFKTKYYEQDFYVSSNNFSAYRLIESWPNWPGKWVNIFGPKGCGKTHLSNILKKKINSVKIVQAKDIDNEKAFILENLDCLIIDNFDQNNAHNVFVKSSTGFYVSPDSVPNGATVSAIKLMLDNSSPLPVKASGGIRNIEDFKIMIDLGVKRIGTSSALSILHAKQSDSNY